MIMANKYKLGLGVWKSIKNVLITVGIPAVIYLINNAAAWMEPSLLLKLSPIISLISYFIKNYVQNK